MAMANPLVDALEPEFNGGILNPLLAWAGKALPPRLLAESPAGVLHRVVTADNRTAESLGAIFGTWMHGRVKAHKPYFVLSGLIAAAWLVTCCCLLVATVCKERRRRARLVAADADAVDAAAASPSRYRLFFSMVARRYRKYRRRGRGKADGGGPNIDSASSLNNGRHLDFPDSQPMRVSDLSANKALSGQDRSLLGIASAAAIVCMICVTFLIVYFTQAGSLVAFTSSTQPSHSIRSIVVATVGHLDRFLNRSLVESNRTIIDMFERSYPPIERLFMNFGEELLEQLMADYKIDALISRLEAFLQTVNATMGAMRHIAGARETVIKPLQQFSAQLQVHREGLHDPLAKMCSQHGGLFPGGECHALVNRLQDLRLEINDTKLETDSSVTIVTLLNKMLKLDIDNVQSQVQKAKESLSTGLRAISGVVRQLLSGLIDAVSSQFSQAELAIGRVKAGFDLVASDPQLWGTVEAAGGAALALVLLSCLVFALTLAHGGILLWALFRYLRTTRRLDRHHGSAACFSAATSPRSLEHSSSQRSSLDTSGFSSSSSPVKSSLGTRNPSSPLWRLPLSQPIGFSENWLDVELDTVDIADVDKCQGQMRQQEKPQQQQKLNRLVDRERNGFIYCCSFDCSLALLVGALLTLLPLLFGLVFFYVSAEAQVDTCRYLATQAGNQRWDGMLDEFAGERLWPLVRNALRDRPDLPICVPQFPEHLLRAVRTDCADTNQTLFNIFGLTGLLNATALLNANVTRDRFQEGASLIKDQINSTDANALIPPELDSLASVLPQIASVLDAEDYTDSIDELGKPLLAMPGHSVAAYVNGVDRAAFTVQRVDPGSSDAAIVRHTVVQLNASMARSAGLRDRLDEMRLRYSLLQDSRNMTIMTASLLAALDAVRQVLADKDKMLEMVDERFLPILERHLPRFADFLDPLAVDLLNSVGYCDDLHLAMETLAVDLCSEAVPRATVAAFLLLVTIAFFAVMFGLSWWLLVRVGRHQAAQCETGTFAVSKEASTSRRAVQSAPRHPQWTLPSPSPPPVSQPLPNYRSNSAHSSSQQPPPPVSQPPPNYRSNSAHSNLPPPPRRKRRPFESSV